MATKESIILEALHCFTEIGYDGTSISTLAERCGVTKGSIYHHFASKDEIFFRSIDLFYRDYDQWFQKRLDDAATIKDFIFIYFDYPDYFNKSAVFNGKSVNAYRLIIDTVHRFPALKANLVEKYTGYLDFIKDRLIEAQKKGELKNDVNCEAWATQIFMLFEALMLFDTVTGEDYSLDIKRLEAFESLWEAVKK